MGCSIRSWRRSVDAALNNYVALHYKSHHMSWLHCMWGVGATLGPYIMGFALSGGKDMEFRLPLYRHTSDYPDSLPLWTKQKNRTGVQASDETPEETHGKPLSLAEIIRIPGAKEVMLCFFCYCAIEQTASLWASSYLNLFKGIPAETAARFAGMFFIGITVGRAISGFITMKLNDVQMIRLGQGIIAAGIVVMLLPGPHIVSLAGLILIGLGCAPVYPCIIHSTPDHFGAERSQAVIGVQMASAYIGTCLMPPLFGLIANHISITLFPVYLMVLLILMIVMHELLTKKTMQ